ncbi:MULTISPECIES: hypothetical protein [Dictyoglomus]|jgi:hypothetical protein|uniref:Uncharacterized protein n=1 Tax=Dictyoglomus turgidum (strain DSM 6724 / Z-1310) TaxID=515635 RepID=B8E157_DICTD|nr:MULTISPECIES: hypothetical protein [Dictyoglomus]ACK42185.1 conserved hypothetical protein [Dictyoglomus turgidum DSM 6724]PNV80271.1 MAG: hypothetical protein C0196_02935 [Dictyoglomus turgidum]HBU32415.1 hypothetical protein [Dictyoglomus sp.]
MSRCISCNKKKGKRRCPALSGLICTECCGTKRLKEINCPPDCTYLKEAQLYSIVRVEEKPADFQRKQWDLFWYFESLIYKFLLEFSSFTDEELLDVISLMEKEYQTRKKNLFLPSLHPRSTRASKLKSILEEEFTKLEKQVNDFGLPIFTLDDFLKVLSFEKERIERYMRKNRNVGNNLFIQVLRSEVEAFTVQRRREKIYE